MVNLASKLNEWTSEYLEGSDEFLVDIEHRAGSGKFRILVDGLQGITIKRCAMISRFLSKKIDEDTELDEDDYFTLEVSSPGADRPLKLPKQFYKHVGRKLQVEKQDEQVTTGILSMVDDEKIEVAVEVSKKETVKEQIEFKNIKQANVIISFN